MPSSTAKREKLVGPIQLVLLGVLFAASFLYLLPQQEAFAIAETSFDEDDPTIIGELDLAYLKARNSAGQATSQETTRAVVALVNTGQITVARDMLEKQPDIHLDERERFSLDLEMANVDFFEAEDDRRKEVTRLQLINRIELLLKKPQLRTLTFLERGAELSAQLDKIDTAISLYKLLADVDSENAAQWYVKCARGEAALGKYVQASKCFDQAIAKTEDSDAVFDLRLEQLHQVTASGNVVKQNSIIDRLSTHSALSNDQIERLASAMLANSRPEKAYPMYAYLAKHDKIKQVHWLLEASKWAQASNNAAQAAAYIDQAAHLSTGNTKVELLERAVSLLIAAGKNEEALKRFTARLNKTPNNASVLREGIKLAQQLGKNDQAALWNTKLVSVNPGDREALKRQIDLALASKDLKGALKWVKLAVDQSPDSEHFRLRLAQVSEWAGDPTGAQNSWQWIATHFPTVENISQVVRLSEMNRDSAVAAEYLRKLVMLTPSDNEKVEQLVKLYELEGRPLTAASFLIELQAKNGASAFIQRELARLYQRHVLFSESLAAWTGYADKFGRSTEETLNRMELLWRLKRQEEAAEVSKHLIGTSNASEASKYQIHLISEIAWAYRLPELANLIKPRLAVIEDEGETIVLGRRLVQSLEDAGNDEEAILQATKLWQSTQSPDMAFVAMNLAYRTGSVEGSAPFLDESAENAELQSRPEYWNLAASIHQKNGDSDAAIYAYKRTLELDNTNATALSGMLWSYIDSKNTTEIANFIQEHQESAETEPALWSPFGLAYLQLGLAEESLTWFDRQLDRIEADYNMLLTFADALEYAGRAEPARKVRLYTIRKLRPALTKGSEKDQNALLRQYTQLLNRYGSAEDKEKVAQLLLNMAASDENEGEFWQEDMAISWLMATQRHEHARVVMAKLHQERLKAPAWQELALAMAANDLKQIKQLLNNTGDVSVGNHILALRQLGKDQQAYDIAKQASLNAPSLSDRTIARGQYLSMRGEKPKFIGGRHRQISMSGLGITESGLSVRHSFDSNSLGIAFDYTRRAFTTDNAGLAENGLQQDVALSLFHGNRQFGGKLTAGVNKNDAHTMPYASSKTHLRNRAGTRSLTAEFAYNEASNAGTALRIAGKQHRASLVYEQALGYREYMKLQADMSDIKSRVQEKRVARGLQAGVEFGIKGAFGSNAWTTSIAASKSENELAKNLPGELNLPIETLLSTLIEEETTAVSLGVSLSRGGIRGDYPQASSPRYYFNANLAHIWPKEVYGLKLDAGAGIRVLGGDELSIAFTHDSQLATAVGSDNDSTTLGVNYWYHF